MIIFRSNSMREIDCAHSQIVKTLFWSWFREGIGVLKRKSNIFEFLWENRWFLGFLGGESIARIPEPWKRFLDPDSGKESVYWSENRKFFGFLWENRRFLRFSRRGIDCEHSWTVKMLPWPSREMSTYWTWAFFRKNAHVIYGSFV